MCSGFIWCIERRYEKATKTIALEAVSHKVECEFNGLFIQPNHTAIRGDGHVALSALSSAL